MLLLPLAEIVTRRFLKGGVPGSTTIVQHLTLWVGFLGAALAARDGKLLALATATFLPDGRGRRFVDIFRAVVTSAVVGLLIWGALDLVASEKRGRHADRLLPPGMDRPGRPSGLPRRHSDSDSLAVE